MRGMAHAKNAFETKPAMKKIPNKMHPAVHNLGELIALVGRYSRNQGETVATVADLLDRGRVRFQTRGQKVRVRIS